MEILSPDDSANSPGERPENHGFGSEEAKAKSQVSRLATVRIQSFERAMRFVPLVEKARAEIAADYERKFYLKDVGYRAIAEWLNQYRGEHGRAFSSPKGGDWSGKQVAQNLMEAPARIIEEAVLECRTRVTALALGRAFHNPQQEITELEQEYLGYIADALEIEHRLNGNRPRSREELLVEAWHKAIQVAADQRQRKELSMMARERLWNQFPPVVRKVFQQPEEPQSSISQRSRKR